MLYKKDLIIYMKACYICGPINNATFCHLNSSTFCTHSYEYLRTLYAV